MTTPPAGLILTGVRDADAATAWLLRELEELPLGPFEHPVVLANHPALRRALMLGIARAMGCAASVRFVSPAGWVDDVAALEGVDGEWRAAAMTWRLTESLTEYAALLPRSARQIIEGQDTVALLELARAVAQRFRAYVLHRSELLVRWESAEPNDTTDDGGEGWQRAMWRALVHGSQSRSPAQIIADVRAGKYHIPDNLPPVILVVADPTMPPAVRDVLCAIAKQREIRWCVVAHAGTNVRAVASERLRAATLALAPLGLASTPIPEGACATLLERVQRLLAGGDVAPVREGLLDDTLTLHACHSPLREIETLRERLLAALESEPTLRPHNITLYVTSLERYLPAIDAVFGVDEPGIPRIPYSVAGRPFGESSPLVFAFMRLLEVSAGRATLDDIGALLRLPSIADAAQFTEEEASAAMAWALKAGIVWGADGADRHARFALPPLEAGTWQHGINRLVLGVAMGRGDATVGDILPVSGDSAGHADLVGRIAAWSEDLFGFFAELRVPRTAGAWKDVLDRAAGTYVAAKGPDDFEALRTLRTTIGEVLDGIARMSHDAPLALGAVRALLEEALEQKAGELGHLRGGMRVCRIEPGTVLPAPVVLIAGVDDALHPLGGGTPAWDLLQRVPQNEDPDRRADALDAFREAIASARSRVHVSWTGFTMAKHEARAPSVAVSELRDLAQRVLADESFRRLVREEPAHPFSASLFAAASPPERLQSAAQGWGQAAVLVRTRGESHQPFAGVALNLPGHDAHVITLDALAECLKDPTLFFCKRTLGLQMQDADERLAEREPQAIDPPDADGVDNALRAISWRLESAQRRGDRRSPGEIREWLRHQPEMPYGEEGRELAAAVAEAWWPQIDALRGFVRLPPKPVRIEVGKWTIVGRLDRLTADSRLVESLYRVRPYSALAHWAPHLAMNVLAARGESLPSVTRIVDTEGWMIGAVDDAEAELARLCAFYDEASAAPQPLFRKAGCAWLTGIGMQAEADATDDTRYKARTEARKAWNGQPARRGTPAFPGEHDQAWNQLCWPDRRIEDDDTEFVAAFVRCTERVLLPFMRAHAVMEGA